MEDILMDRTKYNDNYIKYLYKLTLLNELKQSNRITDKEHQAIKNHIIVKYNVRD